MRDEAKIDRVEANLEDAYREFRKKDYLLHLWKVNRPHYTEARCLEIIAPRAGYNRKAAQEALKRMGVIKPKRKGSNE